MRSSAVVATPEAEALALRMRKHFARKVNVEVDGAVSRVRITAGEFELEPQDGRLAVRARADDDPGLTRVKEVVGSHLGRFAREAPVALAWSAPLEERALEWIAPHRNANHLIRTRDWARELRPDVSEALVVAALTHDVERGIPGGVPLDEQIAAFDDEQAVRAHSERSAALVADWLETQTADNALVARVAELIRLHEFGGDDEANVLQAADSLSFLETNPAVRWIREGRAASDDARRKLVYMRDRIRLAEAREVAGPLYDRAVGEVDEQAGRLPGGGS